MALFGQPNENKIQQQMFDQELQFGREQGAIEQAGIGDDVSFAQRERNEDLTKWQQDLKSEIELTIHDLKREIEESEGTFKPMLEFIRKDEQGRSHYKKVKPMMNRLGINMFRGSIRPLISRNLMMSNYNEEKIFVKLRSIMFTFISHLAYHHKAYDIDVGNLSVIVRMFKDIAEPAHWRCLNNGERQYLNTINKRIEAIAYGQPQQAQQKKGLLNQLMG